MVLTPPLHFATTSFGRVCNRFSDQSPKRLAPGTGDADGVTLIAIQYGLSVADFVIGARILEAR